jgi:hypothetical protein
MKEDQRNETKKEDVIKEEQKLTEKYRCKIKKRIQKVRKKIRERGKGRTEE